MDSQGVIVTGAFTIEPADGELVDALMAAMDADLADQDSDDAAGAEAFLDVRRIVVDDGGDRLPALFALAMDMPGGPAWLVRGELPIALIRIKEKHRQSPKILRSLVAWAETFSPIAAVSLVAAAYDGFGFEDDDDSIHLLVDLPLTGIDPHRRPDADLEEWLDGLTETAEDVLDQVEADAEVVLFDSGDDDTPSLAGHIVIYADTEDDAIDLVRDALLRAFAAFTPFVKVEANLSIEVEEHCLQDLYSDLIDGAILGDTESP
jgi:hypothetical protein